MLGLQENVGLFEKDERGGSKEGEIEGDRRGKEMDLYRNIVVIKVGITLFADLGHKSDRFQKNIVVLICH